MLIVISISKISNAQKVVEEGNAIIGLRQIRRAQEIFQRTSGSRFGAIIPCDDTFS